MPHRRAAALLPLALCAPFTALAASPGFPDRPIRWIVPAAAGGAADITVRVVAAELGNRLGQRIVVDNRPGGSGTIGLELGARALPDGHTLVTANSTNIAMNRPFMKTLAYDPDRDLQAVAALTVQPNLLGVTASLPVKSVADLVAHARTHPDRLLFGSSGVGSSLHLSAELFKVLTGVRMQHVPFKSTPQANTELIAGHIHLMFDNLSSIVQHVKAGRVRGLAVTGPQRSKTIPELPTVAEAGVPGYEVTAWGGVVCQSGVPRRIVERLNVELNKVLADPAIRESLNARGYETSGGSATQFGEYIRKEAAKWADVVRRAGIKTD